MIKWGAIGAIIFLGIWTLAKVAQTPMPENFAQMQPMGLVGAGFFWGGVMHMLRSRLHG